ncbi:hypothetical protein GCM10010254_62640 [Streptomyces chromofuscus]|nr:hypothetical protein GCM10010254_62640 [Streptomyces chromofuscus]
MRPAGTARQTRGWDGDIGAQCLDTGPEAGEGGAVAYGAVQDEAGPTA